MKTKYIIYSFIILAFFSIGFELIASQSGIAGYTASPSESNCTSCHSSYALNTGGGSIVITHNIPAAGYSPSTLYTVTVTVSKTSTPLFGFDFEALSSTNASIGTIAVTNTTTMKLLTSSSRSNIVHKSNGGLSTGSKAFSFSWTSPASASGNITFYAAGIAANNNGNESGDYVYTTNLVVSPAASNAIATSAITGSPFCSDQTGISIPFTASGTFNAGNVFNAQMSDATGSFTTPTTIGSLTSTTAGTIVSTAALPNTAGSAYRIRVVSTNPVTTGTDNGTNLSVIAKPTTSNAGIDQSVCASTATLAGNTPTVGTGSWTVISGSGAVTTASSPSSGVTGLSVGANTFVWKIINSTCNPSYDTIVITRANVPTVSNAGIDQTVCSTSTALAGNSPSVGLGIWSVVSGTATVSNPTSYNSTVSNLSTGVNKFAWNITNSPCPISTDTVIINKSASVTTSNAGVDQSVCGTTATLAANTPSVGTGSWSVIAGSGSLSNTSNPSSGVTTLSNGANIFVWTIANGICSPSYDTVIVTKVLTPTAANAGVDQNVCSSTAVLNANTPTTGNGVWSVILGSAALTNSTSANSTVSNLSSGTNKFVWTISNAPCPSSYDTVSIERAASVITANAGLDQNVCNSSTNLSGNVPSSGTGTWSVIVGSSIVSNVNSASSAVTGLSFGNNTFVWSISNGICLPTNDTVVIHRLNPTTSSNAGLDQNVCTSSATLSANNPSSGTGQWSVITGSATLNNSNSNNTSVSNLSIGANTFVWTISNPPCAASYDTVIVNKSGQITIANAGNDQIVCGQNIATLSANTPTSGTGLWSVVGGAGIFTNTSNPNTDVSGLNIGTNIFVWTISNGVCAPSMDTVILSKYQSPTQANAGSNQYVCSTAVSLNANTPVIGNGVWQLISGAGTITNTSNPSTSVTLLGSGDNVFRWTVSSPPCPSSSSEVTITNCNLNSTIATGLVSGSPFCNNSSYYISVPFSISGSFNGFYSLELSDSMGSFNNTTVIGAGTQSPINATIPANTPVGNKYRVRVRNSSPAIVGTDNGTNLAINVCLNNSILTGNIIGSPFCNSTSYSVLVPFVASGVFNGFYSAELSDSLGSFTNPIVIGAGTSSPISSNIPSNAASGNKYRIRVKNSSPLFFGVDNGTNISINNCINNTITTSSIFGSPFCENTSYDVQVAFTTTGSFTGYYTAQLSDANGTFTNPTPIGMGASSPINATLPIKTSNGSNYRIRVVNSNPYTIGADNGVNLEINSCMLIIIDTISGSPFCSTTSYNVHVPYKTIGSFSGPMVVEMSSSSGSFDNPISIGYGYNSPISAKLPSAAINGTKYRLRLRNSNQGVFSNANTNDLSVNNCSTTGIEEGRAISNIKIYPNPSHGVITIESSIEQDYLILNSFGQVVKQFKTDKSNAYSVNVIGLEAGLYFVTCISENSLLKEKIVIMR